MPSLILQTNTPFDPLTNFCRVVAAAAGENVEMEVVSSINAPLLKTEEGNLRGSVAIAKYVAYGHASLLGSNSWESAKVD